MLAELCYNGVMQVKSITQITQYIKALIDSDQELADLWIEGEVSNFKRASSGHCYFSLKDDRCEIRCVMWRGVASRLGWFPQQGDWARAHGQVSVYERSGAYQFYANALEHAGVGDLWREYERLKAKLEAEGLFDPEKKRSLPEWPRRIGVVTSPTGAALHDIERVLAERYPLVEVVLSPSLVQGREAPAAIVAALGRLAMVPDLDVIIVARGGGSIEDLWAFNSEAVARAIAASRVPVVSGVGHETDFTIADFVADLRTPTPSAAAAAVVPDRRELMAQVDAARRAATSAVVGRMDHAREQLARQAHLLGMHDPRRALVESRQRLDVLFDRGTAAVDHRLELMGARLAERGAVLAGLDPRAILARGYAVVRDKETGVRIGSVEQVYADQRLRIDLQDGHLTATVGE